MIDGADRDRDRATPDDGIDPIALFGRHLLGVVEAWDPIADAQYHRPADDGAREWTHADLVHARHDLVSHREGPTLELPQLWPHLFESSGRGLRPPCT